MNISSTVLQKSSHIWRAFRIRHTAENRINNKTRMCIKQAVHICWLLKVCCIRKCQTSMCCVMWWIVGIGCTLCYSSRASSQLYFIDQVLQLLSPFFSLLHVTETDVSPLVVLSLPSSGQYLYDLQYSITHMILSQYFPVVSLLKI